MGGIDRDELAPTSALADLAPGLRARWAGVTRVYAGGGHLTAELFAVEAELVADCYDQAPDRVRDAPLTLGWSQETNGALTTWRQENGPLRRWITLHPTRASCPIPLQIPQLDGASFWVERGEYRPAEPDPPAPAARRPRWWRRTV